MTRMNVLSSSPIVLVHGALTDASVWHPVIARLQGAGHDVHAPALPMRGLEADATYLAAYLGQFERPVVLVAHSYAGSVISHPLIGAAATLRALVFVAAFQPDQGETTAALNERFEGSLLTPENLTVTANPLGGDDLLLRADRFAAVYAGDVEPRQAAVMAVSQRPIDPVALGEPLPGRPTWRDVPSWAIVATADRSLPPQILRFMAQRAGSHITEVDSAHAVPVAHPELVAHVIAAAATDNTPAPTLASNN